ncbi:MAG TPA: hypothetical protein VGN18_13460 [Jatrophihabitans sp.]|jgi:hypothetical protein|uniref:hypothetical protein n=1 Tax=Jatrophihabitans sp. TaxID=1932789 RepID=UPI002E05431F|nr:hypothetical protein [Jatrophihabitans sp.]
MADYNYGNDRVHLGDEKSQNTASGLGGYSLDVSRDGSWPGLNAAPDKQRVHPEKMNAVAGTIESIAQGLQASHFTEIQSSTSVSYGPNSWGAAVYLKDASGQVAQTVTNYTQQLIANLTDAANAIRKASGGYQGAESTNTSSATNQQASLDQGPSTSSKAF